MVMATTPLKGCPFCGREPDLRDYPDALAANGIWQIECHECDVYLATHYIGEGYEGGDKRPMLTLAIRRWNRRKG